MTSDGKAFIRDNKEFLNGIFIEMHDNEKAKVFTMPEGKARNIQIEFVKFLKNWLYQIEIYSKEEKIETKDFI